jgi:hypothetical protein
MKLADSFDLGDEIREGNGFVGEFKRHDGGVERCFQNKRDSQNCEDGIAKRQPAGHKG